MTQQPKNGFGKQQALLIYSNGFAKDLEVREDEAELRVCFYKWN